MKNFLEPEIKIINLNQEKVLMDSLTNVTEGGGETGVHITNDLGN